MRVDPLVRERGHQGALHRAHVDEDVVDPHDRVPDELARAVVGDAPAAVGLDHVDPLREVPRLAHRQLARRRAPAPRVHRRVLEQEQDV